ncbi:alpha/beta fold hydrolase [Variovorax sp. RHLX14]|uniref:alpha/beta fold hydrolase n=1 Tax=Variovorax sp. RHLX14 TaxID=1259731 RepID=UPI003F4734FB
MIETFQRTLPNGIVLDCRAAGISGRPLMLFLHGFPEAAFIWDALLRHFSLPENGGYRCIAPNLRGFAGSSAPADVASYKAHLLVQDIRQLVATESEGGTIAVLVAHDWGGAFGWGMANAFPQEVQRLVIVNSPHPGTFARELRDNPAQQEASAYMHFLSRPDAEALLAEGDYRRMWGFFTSMGAGAEGFGWLTEAVKAQYREVWNAGLTGACNLYRVTPLKPPFEAGATIGFQMPPHEKVTVDVPTLVIWALGDTALLPGLLDGLDAWVPELDIARIPDATHWIVHEQPERVMREIAEFIDRHPQRPSNQ